MSELEELVLQFINIPSNQPNLDVTTVIKKDSSGLSKSNPNLDVDIVIKKDSLELSKSNPNIDVTTVIKKDSSGLLKSNSSQCFASAAKSSNQVPDGKQEKIDLR